MMLRNVVARTVRPYVGSGETGLYTEFKLDCGHTARRHGEQMSIHRLLCGTCASLVAERTARARNGL